MELWQFMRRLKLHVWFDNDERTNPNTVSIDNAIDFQANNLHLFSASDFVPTCPQLPNETFFSNVRNDLDDLRRSSNNQSLKHPNLTSEEIRDLTELINNPQLTIKSSDKGGAIVVMDTSQYLLEAHRQLADTNVYWILPDNPVNVFAKKS